MKNLYVIGICLLFCTFHIEAMPIQTNTTTTEIAVVKKPTFAERMMDKILKKKFKKIQKETNVKTNRLATASLILGSLSILSLLVAVWFAPTLSVAILSLLFTPLSGVIGVILGAVALNRMRQNPNQSDKKVLAIIGLTLGAIGAATILIMLATGYIV